VSEFEYFADIRDAKVLRFSVVGVIGATQPTDHRHCAQFINMKDVQWMAIDPASETLILV